jgi:hypothetical protein
VRSLKLSNEVCHDDKCDIDHGFGIDTFGVGEDTGQPVTEAYQPPFPFNGEIERVSFEI